MSLEVDYLIVGSGLTGATIARVLADHGREVVVLDRRAHIGGNVYDDVHVSGIRYHTYGPHSFRTSSPRLWEFVNRFDRFYKFEAVVLAEINGELQHWPVTTDYIARQVGSEWSPEPIPNPKNFEEACLNRMPQVIYQQFIAGYTEKQWGVPPAHLEPGLARRIEVRKGRDVRLKTHRYQGLPEHGYAHFMENLLANIDLQLNVDYLRVRDQFKVRKHLVFTGPIDEFFHYDLGNLAYRGQQRSHLFVPDADLVFPCFQINYPSVRSGPHVRIMEWKHMLPPAERNVPGSLLTLETPYDPNDPNDFEYPFPSEENRSLYEKYRRRALSCERLLICGRLGEYRYYDMDQAIARAFVLAHRLLRNAP